MERRRPRAAARGVEPAADLVPSPRHLKIEDPWSGLTVLEVVRRAFPEVTAREVFRKARAGDLRVGDAPCQPLARVAVGDRLTVTLYRPPAPRDRHPQRAQVPVETPAGPFWLVWEDGDLLAVSKPPRCASHPALKHAGDTLLDRVRAYLGVTPADPFQPALANRLDIDTTGVVLIGKTRGAQRRLGRHLQRGLVDKRYLALVGGWPGEDGGELGDPLLKRADSRDRGRFAPEDPRFHGRLQGALTRYRVIERLQGVLRTTLLEVELVTGRTHQIRRHFTAAGHPLAGDERYGAPALNADLAALGGLHRIFLHAHRATLEHPGGGARLTLEAPLPGDLLACLAALGSRVVREPGALSGAPSPAQGAHP